MTALSTPTAPVPAVPAAAPLAMSGRAAAVVPAGTPLTAAVETAVREHAHDGALPAYVYDLAHLRAHLVRIRAALVGTGVELLHAVKANPDAAILATVVRHVDGLEVASGGELSHVRAVAPGVPLAFGGPGKTDGELAAAVAAGVDRFHVESLTELRRLDATARAAGARADVLLRVNIPAAGPASPGSGAMAGPALTMGGAPSPFGMDPAEADAAARELPRLPGVEVLGVHAHLASGLGPEQCAAQAEGIAAWAAGFAARHGISLREVNVGGGMDVDYGAPARTFDWEGYGARIGRVAAAHPGVTLRIEPGRAVSAYSGWYASRVLDVKRSHGEWFAVCSGGTHHLRTPAAKGHSQPLAVLREDRWEAPWERPASDGGPVTFVGQLCTPKDVLARQVPVPQVRAGDLVVFAMAGAYAHNISHTGFLMHPDPAIVHVGG
ncbi:type III PLP-dependent enzyme [Sinomonas mesophila]|uniref:type III PLP-dependent enzyme n=1 Tax=Sinomonas mesophila TaxID=1531955 RepID=UPI001FE7923C|nr:type III PLP-dependent enzyme [Sinomonas mesophila]